VVVVAVLQDLRCKITMSMTNGRVVDLDITTTTTTAIEAHHRLLIIWISISRDARRVLLLVRDAVCHVNRRM
jgi:hypothetical protein